MRAKLQFFAWQNYFSNRSVRLYILFCSRGCDKFGKKPFTKLIYKYNDYIISVFFLLLFFFSPQWSHESVQAVISTQRKSDITRIYYSPTELALLLSI
jgi:hypothetical protein